MFDDPRLLVVDDEEVICQGCRRIFSPQGFGVETSTDPREGLVLASKGDYVAVLLDIKMPAMDGIQFLEELRKQKPDVPVIIITGYPSISNARSAIRLGASDYVTKPFSPEEITTAVQKLLRPRDRKEKAEPAAAPPAVEAWVPAAEAFRFWDESWVQLGKDGSVRVGAVLTSSHRATLEAVRLPRLGDVVHQGLPLASLSATDGSQCTMPSPISGVVVAVNESLTGCPSALWSDPCGTGWVACISPSRLEEDVKNCRPRRVILVNPDETGAHDQSDRLTFLGCQVRIVGGWDELAPMLPGAEGGVLVIDGFWFGEHGPELVGRINAAAPSMKIVVVASTASTGEAAYREHKIFYYAVEPFADNEIVDILDAAFRPRGRPPGPAEHLSASSESVSKIRITNRNGTEVGLLVASGLLRRADGLGRQIRQKLLDRLYPIETTLGNARITTRQLLEVGSICDHLLILLAKDVGRLPGSLVRDTKGEFVPVPPEAAGKVTTLVVQADSHGGGPLELDVRTTASLAEHIVNEMASC